MTLGLNEILLYCGGGVSVAAVVGAGISFFVFRLKKERLMAQLEKEYGER